MVSRAGDAAYRRDTHRPAGRLYAPGYSAGRSGLRVGSLIGMVPGLGPMQVIAIMIPIAIGLGDPLSGDDYACRGLLWRGFRWLDLFDTDQRAGGRLDRGNEF